MARGRRGSSPAGRTSPSPRARVRRACGGGAEAAAAPRRPGRGAAEADHGAAGHPHRHRQDRELDPGAEEGHRADHDQDPAADPLRGVVDPHARRGEAGADLRAGPRREGQGRLRLPGQGRGGHRGLGGGARRAHHRERHLQGPALRPPLRLQDPVPHPLRALRAPHLARPHHRRGAGHQPHRRQVHPGRPRPAADPGGAVRDRHRERDPVPAHGAAHHHRRPHPAVQLALPEPLHRARDQALQAPRHPALA